eukprot:156909-Pyramimonas_sp.AAC.1
MCTAGGRGGLLRVHSAGARAGGGVEATRADAGGTGDGRGGPKGPHAGAGGRGGLRRAPQRAR